MSLFSLLTLGSLTSAFLLSNDYYGFYIEHLIAQRIKDITHGDGHSPGTLLDQNALLVTLYCIFSSCGA